MYATTIRSTQSTNDTTLKDASDDELLAHIRTGSRAAVAELYARHARKLRAIGVKRLGKRDGEDIAQDVFLVVLEIANGSRFAPAPGKVGAWLRAIAVRAATKRRAADFDTDVVDADEVLADRSIGDELS